MLRERQIDHILFHYHRAMREVDSSRRGKITLIIVRHRDKADGEWEVASAWLRYRGRDYQLLLSVTHLWLLYCLCRSGALLTAAQIASRLDQCFYGVAGAGPRTARTTVRMQIHRLREAMRLCFAERQLNIDPTDIVQSTKTSTRETRYRVNANIIFKSRVGGQF